MLESWKRFKVTTRVRNRIVVVCYLVARAFVCLAQERPPVPAEEREPTQLQLERLKAPENFTALVNNRKWEEVLKVALRGLSENPGDPQLHYWAGVARFHQRDFVQAVRSLRSAEKLGLDTAAFHEALGVTYYAVQQRVLFLQQMKAAIRADPGDPMPYHYLGRYYEHDANDYVRALSWFDKALQRNHSDFKSLHFRGFCFQMLGRDQEARADYEQAIRCIEAAGETFSWPYQKLADLLIPTDLQAALQYARKAVELEPAVEVNHLVVAKIYEGKGDLDAAIRECLEAARLKPNDPPVRYILARLYQKKGDSAHAAEELELHEKLRSIYISEQ